MCLCDALRQWAEPTFRLPFVGIRSPDAGATISIQDRDDDIRVLLQGDRVYFTLTVRGFDRPG